MGLYDEVVIEVRTWVEHSADTSERFEMSLDTNLYVCTWFKTVLEPKVTHQVLSPKLAMEKVAKDCGIPLLMSIPQDPDVGLLKPYYTERSNRGSA